MRTLFASAVFVAALALLLTGARADDKGDKGDKAKDGAAKVLKGRITCAKCDLGKEATCMTVIVVQDKDKKDTVYYFDPTTSKKYHSAICTEAKEGTVTGTVSKEGDKYVVNVQKVDYKK